MPYSRIKILEGFYTEDTRVDASNRWVDGDHMRFVTDVPEKIGGWAKLTQQQFLGVCRGVNTWPTFNYDKYLAFGTNLKLYLLYEGDIYDITPYRTGSSVNNPFSIVDTSTTVTVTIPNHGLSTGNSIWFYNTTSGYNVTINGIYTVTVIDANDFTITASTAANATLDDIGGIIGYTTNFTLTNPFAVTNGSNIVTVTSANHGCNVNDFVYFQNVSTVGGLDLNGEWQVTSVIDVNTFQFLANDNANSTTSGGGTVYYLYEINTGPVDQSPGYGYGTGTYGNSYYGVPQEALSTALIFPTIWSLDNWNDDLVACQRYGGIYYWTAETDPIVNRAVVIPNAPAQACSIAVWPEELILVAFGCTDLTGVFNPMQIRNCNVDDVTSWFPAPDNNAGFFQQTNGTQIMQAIKIRGQMLLSTDKALIAMYLDAQTTFAFRTAGSINVLSPNCMVEANGIAFIFAQEQFYIYDGTLKAIKCDIREKIFDSLNPYNLSDAINYSQSWKVYGAHNSSFNEVTWWYPQNPNTECNVYATYNYQRNLWYYGTMDRTAYTDLSEIIPYPVAFSPDGYIYYHEYGVDADGAPLVAYLKTGDIVIAERNRFAYIKNIVPDLLINTTPIQFIFEVSRYPESPATYSETFTISPAQGTNPATDVIGVRVKGGQFSYQYIIDQLGSDFKGGDIELLILPTGAK